MALENTSIAEQFANIGQGTVSSQQEESPFKVDFTDADSPFSNMSGFNIDEIQKDNQLQNGPLDVTKQTTTPPVVDPKVEAINRYKKGILEDKNYVKNFGQVVEHAYSVEHAYGDYDFDQYTSNVDRYRGYGKETFNRLGFNPLSDSNEKYFNENTGKWQDFKRMTGQLLPLVGGAFMSTYNSVGNLMQGKSLTAGDEEASDEQTRRMNIGMSSKGGAFGFTNNLVLNLSYAIGLGLNVAVEETIITLVSGLLAPETGGASIAAGALLQEMEVAKVGKIGKAITNAFRGTKVGQMTSGGLKMLNTLAKVEDAKTFWTGIKTGAETFGKGINPFRQLTEAVSGISSGTGAYRNLSNYAKVSKTFGGFYRDMRENWATISESQLEGGGAYKDILNSKLDIYQKTHDGEMPPSDILNEFYRDAEAGGHITTLYNMPMIFLSNRVVLDGLFNFKGIKGLTNAAEEAFGKGMGRKFAFDISKKGFSLESKNLIGTTWRALKNPKVYAGAFLNFTKHNFMEGFQESAQDLLSGSVKNYYEGNYKHPVLGSNDYLWSSISTASDENIFSAQGLDTFLSGFLMGSAIKGVTSATTGTLAAGKNLFSRIATPEQYKAYVEQKTKTVNNAITSGNSLINDPERFFSRKKESLVNQVNGNNNMNQAEQNKDDKSFYDAKDDKTLDHIFTALDNGTFEKVLAGFKQLNKLSEKDLADYFGLSDGVKAKDKLSEYMKRATEIKEVYDKFQDNVPNPFNPTKFIKNSGRSEFKLINDYKDGTITAAELLNKLNVTIDPGFNQDQIEEKANMVSEKVVNIFNNSDYVTEFIAHKAFEDAKKTAIASEYGFKRAVERMSSVFDDLNTNSPLSKSNAIDFSVLQNEKSIRSEITLLKNEVKGLEQGGGEEKKLAKIKSQKAEALSAYLENLKEFNKNKQVISTNEYGESVITPNVEQLDPLKKSFNEYVKVIAKLNDDTFIFNDKIDSAFSKIVDYYHLNDDAKAYADIVNKLADPAVLLRQAQANNIALKEMYENREQIVAESMNNFLGIHELNSMMMAIGRMGAVVNPDDIMKLAREGVVPTSFFDLKTNQVIDDSDIRFSKLMAIVETFANLKKEDLAEVEKKKAAAAPVVVTPPPVVNTPVVPAIDTELESRLKKGYTQFLVHGNPDVTYDEWVKDYHSAKRIMDEYELEKNGAVPPVLTPSVPAATAPVVVSAQQIATEKAQKLIDDINKLKEIPDPKLSNKKDSTLKLLEMIATGDVKSIDVLNMIESKRKELVANLTVDDISKGDFITFVDGKEGWVTSVTKTGSVQVKIAGSPKNEYDIMTIDNLTKSVFMLEEGKSFPPDDTEPVVLTDDDVAATVASQSVMDNFTDDVASIKKLNDEILNSTSTDNTDNLNNLFDNLGCNTTS